MADVQQALVVDPSSSAELLWLKVVNEGTEDRVEVNQRMLIDKMLARYSSDFVVFRELIQNSDDAKATRFQLEITCDCSTARHTYQSLNNDDQDDDDDDESASAKSTNGLLGGIGQLFRNRWTSSSLNPNRESDRPTDAQLFESRVQSTSSSPSEKNYHNCIITEIRAGNNGSAFSEADWKRVVTIAEGNTNAEAVGQFGVGFFSVFSYCERPMIKSGEHCLAFVWQNGKSLTTFRKKLSSNEQSADTWIILGMRQRYVLQTHTRASGKSANDDAGVVERKRENKVAGARPTRSKKNVTTNEIVPTMDLIELKAYLTKVLSFTKYINEISIKVNDLIVFHVNKTSRPIDSTRETLTVTRLNSENEHHLFHFHSFVQSEQTFSIVDGPSITLNHVDVETSVRIDKDFHEQIQRVLKKSLPSTVRIQFLLPPNDVSFTLLPFDVPRQDVLLTDL